MAAVAAVEAVVDVAIVEIDVPGTVGAAHRGRQRPEQVAWRDGKGRAVNGGVLATFVGQAGRSFTLGGYQPVALWLVLAALAKASAASCVRVGAGCAGAGAGAAAPVLALTAAFPV